MTRSRYRSCGRVPNPIERSKRLAARRGRVQVSLWATVPLFPLVPTCIPRGRVGAAQQVTVPIDVETTGITLILRSYMLIFVAIRITCKAVLLGGRYTLLS